MMEPVACSLILPTRNRRSVLRDTLERIDSLPDGCFETLVVDNASTDGTASLCAAFPRVRWIRPGRNLGAAARNLAASAARGRVLLMLDDDSWPVAGTVDRVVARFDRRPDLGAAACRVQLADESARHDAGGVPGIFFNCGGAVRRSAFIEAGGFPIDYDYYVEEYDLACRLWQRGWRVEPHGDLHVLHRRSLANRDTNRMLRNLVRNNIVLWHRYAPEGRREELIEAAIERYRRVAAKEHAREGFDAGLREGCARIAEPALRRRPLTDTQCDELFGLPAAARALGRWTDKHGITDAAVWSRGKGCEQLLPLLKNVGIRVAAVYDHVDAVGRDTHWRGAVLRPEDRFDAATVEGLVVGSLSPGVAEDLQRALAARFPRLPVLSPAPWMRETPALLAASA